MGRGRGGQSQSLIRLIDILMGDVDGILLELDHKGEGAELNLVVLIDKVDEPLLGFSPSFKSETALGGFEGRGARGLQGELGGLANVTDFMFALFMIGVNGLAARLAIATREQAASEAASADAAPFDPAHTPKLRPYFQTWTCATPCACQPTRHCAGAKINNGGAPVLSRRCVCTCPHGWPWCACALQALCM